MAGGSLNNRRITIRRLSAVPPSEFNEPADQWFDLATVYADIKDMAADEQYRSDEITGEITTRFTIRWNSIARTIDVRDRVKYAGAEYNIISVRETKRNRTIEIDARGFV